VKKQLLNSLLFHQRTAHQTPGENDIFIQINPDVKIGVRLHLISKGLPTIIFFHGNGEIVTDYDDVGKEYNHREINFIIVDYRGYGFSNGKPTLSNILSDSKNIFNYLMEELDKDYLDKVFIMGRSLGSTCALEIASHYSNKINGLIIESGFLNEDPLFNLIGINPKQADFKKGDGFLNEQKIINYFGPLLIIHATQDHIIPFNHGELLFNCCPSTNKKLVPIYGANHNNILEFNFN
ncbi:uncharacterized protein METZ01_LOCUS480968, partial [marine metagenome]